MAFEVSASGRPRPWLLITLGLAVVGLLATWMWPARPVVPAAAAAPAATGRVGSVANNDQAPVTAADLDVRFEGLSGTRPSPGTVQRNPFRFPPKPVPPPPPVERVPVTHVEPLPQPGPPQPPPITLKFIGTLEKQGLKVAALSDCRTTFVGHEGEIIDGRYRLVRIGAESVVLEYADGRGRTTIRSEGCAPVAR